jgi:hypothetical protein
MSIARVYAAPHAGCWRRTWRWIAGCPAPAAVASQAQEVLGEGFRALGID